MRKFLRSHVLLIGFLLFLVANLYVYDFILEYHSVVRFDSSDYSDNGHHFLEDQRIGNGSFQFLRAMGQYDAQWYLKIVSRGYPNHPTNIDVDNKSIMDGLTYAFFPLYPLVVRVISVAVKNIELSAFLLSNVLLVINFFSLYYVVAKLYGKKIGIKTCFLLFFFPFSIFYRSYYPEGLYLLLFIWFGYFLIQRKYTLSAVFLSLLNVTKGNNMFLNVLFFLYLFNDLKINKYAVWRRVVTFVIPGVPFLAWVLFVYRQTGSLIYFYTVQYAWFPLRKLAPFYNLLVIFLFPLLPLHRFHASKIDVIMIVIVGLLLYKSKKYLRPELWWMSFLLYATQLLITDTMSFSRYQSFSFPLFIYIASRLQARYFFAVAMLFYAGLLAVSIFFVNWYWIG